MKAVKVLIPVIRGSRRFIIEKGRRWSVIEHLLLGAVAAKPRSALELAKASGLPRRIIVEAFIRLMRSGWVEILLSGQVPVFTATAIGSAIAPSDELPSAITIERRWRGFAIDRVTGCVFRSVDLDIPPHNQLPTENDDQAVCRLDPSMENLGDFGDIFSALEGEDEVIIGFDSSPERPIMRHAVVTVRDTSIEGLPAGASPSLRSVIIESAKLCLLKASGSSTPHDLTPMAVKPEVSPKLSRLASFQQSDLVIGGPEHKKAFLEKIQKASERVIIHSTFINERPAMAVLPAILQAAARGVKIDILWGQDEERSTTAPTRAEAEKLANYIADAGRSDLVEVHEFSTNSHAKFIISDNGQGGWSGLLGSCNWLSSYFEGFEVSVNLRDPAFVGELLMKTARLSLGRSGVWHNAAVGFTVLGRKVRSLPRPTGREVPMRFLYGADHAELVLEAKDKAKDRLFVTSHRIGIAGKPMVLLPALTAAQHNDVSAQIYYERTTGLLSGLQAVELSQELRKKGVSITPIHQPKLHAKCLGWDNNSLAVTSLNWLSADPADDAPLSEIGIFIEASSVMDYLIRRFEHLRSA